MLIVLNLFAKLAEHNKLVKENRRHTNRLHRKIIFMTLLSIINQHFRFASIRISAKKEQKGIIKNKPTILCRHENMKIDEEKYDHDTTML